MAKPAEVTVPRAVEQPVPVEVNELLALSGEAGQSLMEPGHTK